ncbi:sigma 54-interacting transcriptional regulator [Haematobacter sp. UBA3484]|uniref:sigma 54-interacting transcriptional regulator n=1 Tax=Haematobacter sp. UBA3484 TaxID=1946582 RepID=UPI0025C4483B|nr:sigma 54-interacting transcriptional regulator [Haematobacter sp. UBA3484]
MSEKERGATPPPARQGRFEFANGGAIFLSEVEALSPALQARLARFLQDRTFTRMGDNVSRPVDVRLVAATSLDLSALLERGQFRRDLYFRLTTAEVHLPSLAERTEDIPLLYAHYLMEAARRFRRPEPTPGPVDLETLAARSWPGNLSQLQAVAERHVLGLRAGNAPAAEREMDAGLPLAQKVAEFEASLIIEALAQAGGSSAGAAERLGLPRRTLNEKIARYGLRER